MLSDGGERDDAKRINETVVCFNRRLGIVNILMRGIFRRMHFYYWYLWASDC